MILLLGFSFIFKAGMLRLPFILTAWKEIAGTFFSTLFPRRKESYTGLESPETESEIMTTISFFGVNSL